MCQSDDLDSGICSLSNIQTLWQADIWQAEHSTTSDVEHALSQAVVEVDNILGAKTQVEESVDLLVGVVV